jgi:hypothetical protein
MAKRFVDTELWQKEWFQDLTLKEKILIKYIFENCDCAGVWNGNFKLAIICTPAWTKEQCKLYEE